MRAIDYFEYLSCQFVFLLPSIVITCQLSFHLFGQDTVLLHQAQTVGCRRVCKLFWPHNKAHGCTLNRSDMFCGLWLGYSAMPLDIKDTSLQPLRVCMVQMYTLCIESLTYLTTPLSLTINMILQRHYKNIVHLTMHLKVLPDNNMM